MPQHGGDIIADVLARHGVTHLFTLCGGHISPILTGAQARGISVVDVRDEGNAVFAADAVARMTGTIGVAAVTAGPGRDEHGDRAQERADGAVAAAPVRRRDRDAAQGARRAAGHRSDGADEAAREVGDDGQDGAGARADGRARDRRSRPRACPGRCSSRCRSTCSIPRRSCATWYEKEAGLGKAKGIGAKALELYIKGHLYRQFRAPAMPADRSADEAADSCAATARSTARPRRCAPRRSR